MTCIILHNFKNKNFADFAWKLSSLQFSNKSMLESAQQTNEIDLNDQWFRVACHWLLTTTKKENGKKKI